VHGLQVLHGVGVGQVLHGVGQVVQVGVGVGQVVHGLQVLHGVGVGQVVHGVGVGEGFGVAVGDGVGVELPEPLLRAFHKHPDRVRVSNKTETTRTIQ
jgi:hypothetical protein